MTTIGWNQLMEEAGKAGFELWPAANSYDVEVSRAEVSKTSTGKDQIKAWFRSVSGVPKGTLINNFVISPESQNALAFFFRHMKAMGLDETYFAQQPTLEQVAQAIVGRRCRIKVGVRKWNEQDQNDVQNVLPPASAAGQQPVTAVAQPGVPSGVPAAPAPAVPNGTAPAPAPVATASSVPPAPDPQPEPGPAPAPPQPPAPSEPPAPPQPPASVDPAVPPLPSEQQPAAPAAPANSSAPPLPF